MTMATVLTMRVEVLNMRVGTETMMKMKLLLVTLNYGKYVDAADDDA